MKTVYNTEKNGIEIYFESKPSQEVISSLKSNNWRWHSAKKCWYAKDTEPNRELVSIIEEGKTPEITSDQKQKTEYSLKISDYLTEDEFSASLRQYYEAQTNFTYSGLEIDENIKSHIKYAYDGEYLKEYIRHAIIWKSIGGAADNFRCNGENAVYSTIWSKLPTITGLKKTDKKFSAMWGYDQTNITTAIYYGKAFGLDVLITSDFGAGKVLLKRISKNGTFKEGCMYFSPNEFSDEKIKSVNEYASYYGH